ncbi:MAG: TPM domain-containing protein [Chiayiivirga sp.]|jgi:uncharacterized membrane protein|nr:TPM domain-containing protein [Chiayiivirga sp.]
MRWLRHLFARSAASRFPPASLQRIAAAIAAGEQRHTGQVVFAVEPALGLAALRRGRDARHRAEQLFARLRVWDTQHNNGVLIYLLLADHRIEVVADRAASGPGFDLRWTSLCEHLAQRLQAGAFEAAGIEAVNEAAAILAEFFPRDVDAVRSNELPDHPILLDASPD